jgi:hypothetical protein
MAIATKASHLSREVILSNEFATSDLQMAAISELMLEATNKLHDSIFDLHSSNVELFKSVMASMKDEEDIDTIAEVWKVVSEHYTRMLPKMEEIRQGFEEQRDPSGVFDNELARKAWSFVTERLKMLSVRTKKLARLYGATVEV